MDKELKDNFKSVCIVVRDNHISLAKGSSEPLAKLLLESAEVLNQIISRLDNADVTVNDLNDYMQKLEDIGTDLVRYGELIVLDTTKKN